MRVAAEPARAAAAAQLLRGSSTDLKRICLTPVRSSPQGHDKVNLLGRGRLPMSCFLAVAVVYCHRPLLPAVDVTFGFLVEAIYPAPLPLDKSSPPALVRQAFAEGSSGGGARSISSSPSKSHPKKSKYSMQVPIFGLVWYR